MYGGKKKKKNNWGHHSGTSLRVITTVRVYYVLLSIYVILKNAENRRTNNINTV